MHRLRALFSACLLIVCSAPAAAAIFPCDEAGFDQALAAAGGGDPGPHTFACAPGDLPLVLTSRKTLGSSLTIDGEGQLVLQGLSLMLAGGPLGSLLELRNLTLVDPVIGSANNTGEGVKLSRASVTGNGSLSAVGLAIHDSLVSDYHSPGSLLRSVSNSLVPTPQLDILDSEISDSSAGSGGLVGAGTGTISIVSSTLRDNEAGSGIVAAVGFPPGATGVIEATTISGNQVGIGAAVWAGAGVTIENSTISGNTQPPLEPGQTLVLPWTAAGLLGCATVRNSTLTGNTALTGYTYGDVVLVTTTAGIQVVSCSDPLADAAPAVFENTILDGSCGLTDLSGPPTFPVSHGGNIETGDDTCGFSDATDQVAVTPAELALGALADNGGPTETHALLPGSVARDAAVLANCPPTDQRGEPRPEPGGSACDSGSFEAPREPSPPHARRFCWGWRRIVGADRSGAGEDLRWGRRRQGRAPRECFYAPYWSWRRHHR